jgi:hypothetical protein
MHRGRRADGTNRIVRHQIDIVRFAPAGHVHRLGGPTNIANVEQGKRVDAALDGDIALRLVPGGGESGSTVALLAAEQLVHQRSQDLALDIVQSDVIRGKRGLQHASTFEVPTAICLPPKLPDLHGIPTDQELAIMLNDAGDRSPAST